MKTLFIAKDSPWENGYVESFNSRFRDELLNREIFTGLEDARWVVDRRRLDYNHHRPHSSLDYQTPAEFAARCLNPRSSHKGWYIEWGKATIDPRPFGLSCIEIVTRRIGCGNPESQDLWEPWVASHPAPPGKKLGLLSRI